MTGMTTSKWTFAFALWGALSAGPLAATPIATGPDGLNAFMPGGGSLTYQVVMNNGGAGVASEGFVPGGTPATFTSTTAGTMVLSNILATGSSVTSAMLDLAVIETLTSGAASDFFGCVGDDCTTYVHGHPTFTVGDYPATHTTITVVSTSGTTYTWNYQVTSSSPFQLDLATADPDFLTDLANGMDLNISWTQTIQLSGVYNPVGLPPGRDKCKNCTLTFHYDGLTRSTVVQASVNGDVTGPEDPPSPIPEPSTGLLLGLGIMAMAATLRRRISPR